MRYLPYLIIIAVVLLGILSNSWYLTTFRNRLGSFLFFLNVLMSLMVFALVIYLIGLDYSTSTKLWAIIGLVAIDGVVTICMYKSKA